jgi:hypothetical protein
VFTQVVSVQLPVMFSTPRLFSCVEQFFILFYYGLVSGLPWNVVFMMAVQQVLALIE